MPKANNKIVVYHGSMDETPPHNDPTSVGLTDRYFGFHAGTINAALERVGFIAATERETEEEPTFAYMHAYEIPKNKLSLMTYEDPHNQDYDDLGEVPESYNEAMQVKETRPDRVNKYINRWEDKGSMSYVVPPQLVWDGHVKHLSTQQFKVRSDDVYLERDTLTQNVRSKK